MDIEKQNWIASHNALSKEEKDLLFEWLEKNAEITEEDGVKKYFVPIKRLN
jgi:hypothetical protein